MGGAEAQPINSSTKMMGYAFRSTHPTSSVMEIKKAAISAAFW